jgi:phage baseplate assembly protein W
MDEMDKPFLGRGWRFPILPDQTGGLGYVEGDENIEQSLRILLLTDHGQRAMRFNFGCKAPRLVFAPGSEQNLSLLETTVREAIRDWEPRIELEDVRAEVVPAFTPDDENHVVVSISYRVRQTNTRNNLVFPFYLGAVEQI